MEGTGASSPVDGANWTTSDGTTAWDSIELMNGSLTQLPPDVYEAAVGTANAIGWRGRNCVLIRNARFGSSTVPPVYKFVVITAGTQAAVGPIVQLTAGLDTDAVDGSYFNHTPTFFGSAYAFDGSNIVIGPTISATGVQWAASSLAIAAAQGFTLEGRGTWDAGFNDFPFVMTYSDGGYYFQAEALPVSLAPDLWRYRISGADLGAPVLVGQTYAAGTFAHIALVIPAGVAITLTVKL